MSTVEALVCAEASGIQLKDPFNDYWSRDRLPGQEYKKLLRGEQALKACNEFHEDLQRRKELARRNQISLSDLTDSPSRFNDIGDEVVPAGGQMLRVSAVIDILGGRDLLAGRTEHRTRLEASVDTADAALSTARTNRKDDIAVAKEGVPDLVWYLRYQGWPVVLILLLSLKLARSSIT